MKGMLIWFMCQQHINLISVLSWVKGYIFVWKLDRCFISLASINAEKHLFWCHNNFQSVYVNSLCIHIFVLQLCACTLFLRHCTACTTTCSLWTCQHTTPPLIICCCSSGLLSLVLYFKWVIESQDNGINGCVLFACLESAYACKSSCKTCPIYCKCSKVWLLRVFHQIIEYAFLICYIVQ